VLGLSTAQHAAECGLEVRLLGRDEDHAQKGCATLASRWEVAVQKGTLLPQAAAEARGRVHPMAFGAEAMEGVAVLLEALPEVADQKAEVLAKAASLGHQDLLLLSGTSALPISNLATCAGLSGRLLGFHLFVPVSRMPVVEVAVPPPTDTNLLNRARSLGEALRLRVVVVKDQPGFAAARMALAQGLEAMRLLEAGVASAEDIDALLTLGYGHPVGPLELSDRIGLDLRLRIAEGLFQSTGDSRFEPPGILRSLVTEGATGRKAKRGFYTWDARGKRL
jgi:3-hydroxybutyryl-CoA dehydrogenase